METIPTHDFGHLSKHETPRTYRVWTDDENILEHAAKLERELTIAKRALEQFEDCDLHEGNCASVEVASRRIRRVAIEALGKINTLSK